MPSKEELRRIVEGFAQSGMTRRQYCEKHNIGMSTLDYWRRRIRETEPRLVEIAVEGQPSAGFVLVLANGRRIECSWRFGEAELLRLVRVAEA